MNGKATIAALVIGLASAVCGVAGQAPSAPDYTWTLLAGARDDGLAPVAATRCDRDGDGNPELVVAYAGAGRGALVWFPIVGERFGSPEPSLRLAFEPTGLVSGDFDAEGELELALAVAGEAALMALEIDGSGVVEKTTRHRLPGVAARLTLDDLPRRDGLPDFLIDLERNGRRERLSAASTRGAVAGLADARVDSAGESEAANDGTQIEGTLLTTRVDRDANRELVVARADGSLWLAGVVRSLIVVDSTDDSVDFPSPQQVGDLPGPDGNTTLREAIVAANNTAGVHVIEFNITQAGNDFHDNAWWFTPSDANLGPLPLITASVTLDGYTQTQNRGDTNPDGPELVLDGSGLTGGHGFEIAGDDCAVIDWVVQNVAGPGILSTGAANLVVVGCYLGTTPDGTAAAGNTLGIELADGTTGAVIGGTGTHGTSPEVDDANVLSGNEDGVHVWGAGSTGNTILGNLVGTDRTGSVAVGNLYGGIWISSWAASTVVGGTDVGAENLVSGNHWGISVNTPFGDEDPCDTLIQGNLVGTDIAGLVELPNVLHGIGIGDGCDTTIGGTSPAARNLISGTDNYNVSVGIGVTGTHIQGNWIGIDATGSGPVHSTIYGLQLMAPTVVGGADPGAGNVISGNSCGVVLERWASGTEILGNLIGTDATGAASVANITGICGSVSGEIVIGGRLPGEGNVVSGNSEKAIHVGASGGRVQGNLIGLTAGGAGVLGNGTEGLHLFTTGCLVGGMQPGQGNTIAGHPSGSGVEVRDDGNTIEGNVITGSYDGMSVFSDGNTIRGNTISDSAHDGVLLWSGSSNIVGDNVIANSGWSGLVIRSGAVANTISANSISGSLRLGIDLGDDGVTPNDPGDVDDGPNHLRNFPVIASAITDSAAGLTTVTGTLDTPSPEAGVIELFGSPVAHPSGYGEGETFLGSVTPAADGTFSVDLSAQPNGSVITATFTDGGGSTSEFSAAVTVTALPLEVCASGCAFTTIQAAIDASLEADTVLVHDGTYVENIVIPAWTVRVRSVNGAAVTTIDGGGAGNVVRFLPDSGQSVLEGFTVTGGNSAAAGGGVQCKGGEPTIVDCVISGNQTGYVGGGVASIQGASVTLRGCVVAENTTPSLGGGVAVVSDGTMRIADSYLQRNSGAGAVYCGDTVAPGVVITGSTIRRNFGWGIYAYDCPVTIDGSQVYDNSASGLHAGASPVHVESSSFTENRGHGLEVYGGGLTLSSSVVTGNTDTGVYVRSAAHVLENCTITGNLGDDYGAGVYVGYATQPTRINSCTIAGNTVQSFSYGGAGIFVQSAAAEVTNTIVRGNEAPNASDAPAQIDLDTSSTITVTYSNVEDTWPGTGNIDADALFVDPRPASSAPTSDGDYHLLMASASVDAGTAAGAPADDIDGDSRPQLSGYDMGSDEVTEGVFADGFESGDTSGWTTTVP